MSKRCYILTEGEVGMIRDVLIKAIEGYSGGTISYDGDRKEIERALALLRGYSNG